MPKVKESPKTYRPRTSTYNIRKAFSFFYTEKFFNKWMSKYDFPQLNYQQKHFIMKKFWADGSIAMSRLFDATDGILTELMSSGEIDMKTSQVVFTPWTHADRYNIYDFSTKVRLINTRAVKFINPNELDMDKDVVIIWAQKNHKSVYSSIQPKINELIDIEMKIRLARKAQAQPWLFAFAPEDFDLVKRMQEQLEDDEPYQFIPSQNVDKAKILSSGAPYISDKLTQEKESIINEILTMLGVNNIGTSQKKEHLIVDEVNANNEDIEQQNQSFQSEIEEGFDRANKVLKYKVDVIDNNIIEDNMEEAPKEDAQDDSNDEN